MNMKKTEKANQSSAGSKLTIGPEYTPEELTQLENQNPKERRVKYATSLAPDHKLTPEELKMQQELEIESQYPSYLPSDPIRVGHELTAEELAKQQTRGRTSQYAGFLGEESSLTKKTALTKDTIKEIKTTPSESSDEEKPNETPKLGG